jgi:hypothetical protein
MVNNRLLEGSVARNMNRGYSNADGNVLNGSYRRTSVANAVELTQRDTVGEDGVSRTIQQMSVVRPVADVAVDSVNTTTVSPNYDTRPALIAEGNADAGSEGVAVDTRDMIAGDGVPMTRDSRTDEEVKTTVEEAPANTGGLTAKQKNWAMLAGLAVVAIGGYFVVKHFNK